MNWKYEAMDKLKGYEAHKKALISIPEEIGRLEAETTGIRSTAADRTPFSRGGNRREDALLSNIAHREELERALRQARGWVWRRENTKATVQPDCCWQWLPLDFIFLFCYD